MDRELLRKRIRRNQRSAMLHHWLKTAILVGAAVAAFAVIWTIVKPFLKSGLSDGTDAQAADAGTVQTAEPEAADGSGAAGTASLGEGMTVTFDTPGWQKNDHGWWYAVDSSSHYVNGWLTLDGQQYHLDSDGYMDTGWTAIGGTGYYFDELGVYDADADASMMIALTFDDGPSAYTGALLDILEEHDAQATFLMLGVQVEKYGAETIPRMQKLGCTIGNHSYDHADLKDADPAAVEQEFNQTDGLIAQYTGGSIASVVRFPYGDYTKEGVVATGRPALLWDLDTLDWESKDANTIVNKVLGSVEGGNIVLMHDIYDSTVEACRTLIPQLQAQGYQLVTIEELAASRGYELEAGYTYFSFKEKNLNENRVRE